MRRFDSAVDQERSANVAEFRRVFLIQVHQLIKWAHDRMDARKYRSDEEPAITGDLVTAIESILDDPDSDDWVQFYSIHDDPPVAHAQRKGKHRHKVDIRIDSAQQRPRARFSIEAKRLDQKHPVAVYLGEDGLGCFLRGKYARDQSDAGMLGYVQDGTIEDCARQLEALLGVRNGQYSVNAGGGWQTHPLVEGLQTFRTQHRRSSSGAVTVYHSLLLFQ